jgi:hypothetical protein
MNIQMRIITDENVDQMLSLSYSNNIDKLLNNVNDDNIFQEEDFTKLNNTLKTNIIKVKSDIKNSLTRETKNVELNKLENIINDTNDTEDKNLPNIPIDIKPEDSSVSASTPSEESIPYAPGSPAYQPNSEENIPGTSSPYVPDMNTDMNTSSDTGMDMTNAPILIKRPPQEESKPVEGVSFLPRTPSISPPTTEENKTILEVEEEKKDDEENVEKKDNEGSGSQTNNNSNETKKIVIATENESGENTNSNETKKINL